MEITVVTLVEEQMSPWKGNLPSLKDEMKGLIVTAIYRGENPWCPSFLGGQGSRAVERVMTRGFGDSVAKLGDKVVMEVLVRCWSDGDVVVVKSSREERNVVKSNIGDSDNTRDGGKIVGEAIRACNGIVQSTHPHQGVYQSLRFSCLSSKVPVLLVIEALNFGLVKTNRFLGIKMQFSPCLLVKLFNLMKSWGAPPAILDPFLLDQTHQPVQDPHDPIGGRISPEGFLSSILLWLVVIVAVVGVGVMVVVVVETFEAKWDLRLPLPGIFSNVLEIIPLHCQMVEAKEFHKDRDFFQLSTSSKIHLASFGASLGLLVLSVFCPVSGCVQKLAETLLA
ncbi:hypothetical protein Tco_0092272 [Tanacetum coccineum]